MNDNAYRLARDIADRARAGDQNAVAQIAVVRDKAQAGDRDYQVAWRMLYEYMTRNPPRYAEMGAEESYALGILKAADQNDPFLVATTLASLPQYGTPSLIQTATVALSQASPWTNARVRAIEDSYPDPNEKDVFRFGVFNGPDGKKIKPIASRLSPPQVGTLCAGYCLGTARKIQLARLGNVPPSRVLGSDIGWELGC
jgi:hypothetical protein